MGDGQAMVPVENHMVDGVDHHTGPHGTPANVHVSALSDPTLGGGFVRTKFTEGHEGGTKLHTQRSLACDKDMSSRRRTWHGRW
jgi:hypothetical protein